MNVEDSIWFLRSILTRKAKNSMKTVAFELFGDDCDDMSNISDRKTQYAFNGV